MSADVWTQPMRPLRGSRRVRLDESGELVSATDRALAAERDTAQARRELVEARAEEVSALRSAPAEVVRVVRVAAPAQTPTRRRRPRSRVPVHPVAALVEAFEARARGVRS